MSDAIDPKSEKKKFVFKELVFDDLRLVSGGDGDGDSGDGGCGGPGCGSDASNSGDGQSSNDGGCTGCLGSQPSDGCSIGVGPGVGGDNSVGTCGLGGFGSPCSDACS